MLVLALLAGTGVATASAQQTENPGQSGEAGPPSDLPGPVPDFVEDILGTVQEFLDGSVSDLGSAVSDIAGNESASDS